MYAACSRPAERPGEADAGFVGSSACSQCHARQFADWQQSQHAAAMQSADSTTVLGSFDSTRFAHRGLASTFFRRDGRYFVNTEGPDGKPRDYRIEYTFGVSPLQQYLVQLGDGRLQVLATAWDTRPPEQGGQRWFALDPDHRPAPGDDDHWSGRDYNWNFRCADCHSTAVRKNYDADSNRFRTQWKEISVGCESCHGPAREHLSWGRRSAIVRYIWRRNGLPNRLDERRGVSWVRNDSAPIARRSAPRRTEREIETCAQCHARRIHIADGYTAGQPLLDYYIPFLIDAGEYYPDGQQLDEVYIHGSFLQSRMYRAGVTCADCHDPHTQKLRAPGSAVCAQCHDPARYDAPAHSLHGPQTGATCLSCHMARRTYMVVDPRRDHSFRVPRPDLTIAIGTPNACQDCHTDRDARWAAEQVRTKFRASSSSTSGFATAFAADESRAPGAPDSLLRVIGDTAESAIVRASAVARLSRYDAPRKIAVATAASRHANALMRLAALEVMAGLPHGQRNAAVPLLRDPRRAIRQAAAYVLAAIADSLDARDRLAFDSAAAGFIASQRYNADQPEHRWTLGEFFAARGQLDPAVAEFRAAIRLSPRDASMNYQLGVLLANSGRVPEAIPYLQRAVALRPDVLEFRRGLAAARAAH